RAGAGGGQEIEREVDAHDPRAALGGLLQEDAGAATQLERQPPRAQLGQLREELRAALRAPPAGGAVPVPDQLGAVGDLAVVLDLAGQPVRARLLCGGLAHRNFSLRAAKALMRRSRSPWRKREMLVVP